MLDAFIKCPNNNVFKVRLCNQLDIPIESMDKIINKQMDIINKDKIKNFTPHIRVKWTRYPLLLMMAEQCLDHLYEIEVPESLLNLPIEQQLEEVCHLYKLHQLDFYAEKFNFKNYTELVSIIDSISKKGLDIVWSVSDGFT